VHIKIGIANPTVRTRKQEMVSCNVAVSTKLNHLKIVSPMKRSAYDKKPNWHHLVLYAKPSYAEPAKLKPAHT